MSTMESDYRVLVTGFVPFGGHATNISQTVASAMRFFMSVCVNRVRFLASNGLQATG
jgi:pyrrolidone-carboxylate peptidase